MQDWVIFRKIWYDANNPEETNRLVEIIEDHACRMREAFEISKPLKDAAVELKKAMRASKAARKDSDLNLVEKANLNGQGLKIQEKLDELEAEIADDLSALSKLEQENIELNINLRQVQLELASIPDLPAQNEVDIPTAERDAHELAKATLRDNERRLQQAIADNEVQIAELQSVVEKIVEGQAVEKATLIREKDALAGKVSTNADEGVQYANKVASTGRDQRQANAKFIGLQKEKETAQKKAMEDYYMEDNRFAAGKRMLK